MTVRNLFRLTFIITALMLIDSRQSFAETEPASVPSRKFTIVYHAFLSNIPQPTKKLDVWIPVPHNTRHQEVTDMKVKAPV